MAILSDGRISPVRFQLNQPMWNVAKSTRSYIKRNSKEIVETTLECIAPGQSAQLLALITSTQTTNEPTDPESKVRPLWFHCTKEQHRGTPK